MALMITDECTGCGACVEDCPQQAIDEGDPAYVIDGEKCVECVGYFDSSRCAEVCPVGAPQPDPANPRKK